MLASRLGADNASRVAGDYVDEAGYQRHLDALAEDEQATTLAMARGQTTNAPFEWGGQYLRGHAMQRSRSMRLLEGDLGRMRLCMSILFVAVWPAQYAVGQPVACDNPVTLVNFGETGSDSVIIS